MRSLAWAGLSPIEFDEINSEDHLFQQAITASERTRCHWYIRLGRVETAGS